MNSVAPVGASGDYPVQEDHPAPLIRHRYIEVLDPWQNTSEFHQFVIMGGEEGLRAEVRAVMEELNHRPGDGEAVIGGRATPDLIQDDERARCGIVQDIGRFGHLNHESGLPCRQVLLGTYSCEDAVDYSDACRIGRHEAAHLGHKDNQSHLSEIGRLPRHVWAGQDDQLILPVTQARIVGNKAIPSYALFNNGVASSPDLYGIIVG